MSLDVSLSCPSCGNCSYSGNITHNLSRMAHAAGIYDVLWRPEEIGVELAKQLIEPLAEGLEKLRAQPETFSPLNAPNGWGKYEHFVSFVEGYLAAAKDHPDFKVHASR